MGERLAMPHLTYSVADGISASAHLPSTVRFFLVTRSFKI